MRLNLLFLLLVCFVLADAKNQFKKSYDQENEQDHNSVQLNKFKQKSAIHTHSERHENRRKRNHHKVKCK